MIWHGGTRLFYYHLTIIPQRFSLPRPGANLRVLPRALDVLARRSTLFLPSYYHPTTIPQPHTGADLRVLQRALDALARCAGAGFGALVLQGGVVS